MLHPFSIMLLRNANDASLAKMFREKLNHRRRRERLRPSHTYFLRHGISRLHHKCSFANERSRLATPDVPNSNILGKKYKHMCDELSECSVCFPCPQNIRTWLHTNRNAPYGAGSYFLLAAEQHVPPELLRASYCTPELCAKVTNSFLRRTRAGGNVKLKLKASELYCRHRCFFPSEFSVPKN